MPDARLFLICGAAAAALLLVLALLRSRRRAGPMLTQPRPFPEMKGSFNASAGAREADEAVVRLESLMKKFGM